MRKSGAGEKAITGAVEHSPKAGALRSGSLNEAAAQRSCLELMRHFSSTKPGVRIGELRIKGFSAEQIKSCFMRLRVNRILRVAVAV